MKYLFRSAWTSSTGCFPQHPQDDAAHQQSVAVLRGGAGSKSLCTSSVLVGFLRSYRVSLVGGDRNHGCGSLGACIGDRKQQHDDAERGLGLDIRCRRSSTIGRHKARPHARSLARYPRRGPASAGRPRAACGWELTAPGAAFPSATSASGICTAAANSSMISSIERVFMSISSFLPE